MCAHVISRPALAERSLPYLQRLGVRSLRSDAPWAKVETRRGEYRIPPEWDRFVDTANRLGIHSLLILDYGNPLYDQGDKPRSADAIRAFARYASFVAQHFRGRVQSYEVWNEWDAATGRTTPGTAEAYAELLGSVYPALKAVDPNLTVIGGSLTSGALRGDRQQQLLSKLGLAQTWFQRLLTTQALKNMDGLSVHPYNFMLSAAQSTPEALAATLRNLATELRAANGGRSVPLYVTEMGWPTFAGRGGVSEVVAANYLARSFALLRALPEVRGLWWYQLQDEQWDPNDKEHHFGVLRPDFTLKPAFSTWEAQGQKVGSSL